MVRTNKSVSQLNLFQTSMVILSNANCVSVASGDIARSSCSIPVALSGRSRLYAPGPEGV